VVQVPPGASGSSHIIAILPPLGIGNCERSQLSGGEIFEPSQLYLGGIGPPSSNTVLKTCITIEIIPICLNFRVSVKFLYYLFNIYTTNYLYVEWFYNTPLDAGFKYKELMIIDTCK
jgi:hypothetical protein